MTILFFHTIVVSAQSDLNTPEAGKNETLEGEIYKVVEQMARFPGCEGIAGTDKEKRSCANEKMLEYIYENLVYPDSARIKGIQGMVVIQFIVKNDGSIVNAKVSRDISHDCGKAALDVVESMNNLPERWTPGKQRDLPVHVMITLPVRFKLDE